MAIYSRVGVLAKEIPYCLFSFCFVPKALSLFLRRLKESKKIKINALKICWQAPLINHLLFVDDSLLFCKASVEENRKIQHHLKTYASASGQLINYEKTSIHFNKNLLKNLYRSINEIQRINSTKSHDKYLSLPSLISKSMKQAFAILKTKV